MPLVSGTRLGPYEIQSAIGSGGMGEVYRARDTRLKRDVALKILPESFASDPDRLARFQREAEVLATLNHPNIATVYGLEDADGIRALVMELVEGEMLADRIARGPLPLDEAFPIATQIAEALEAAHEQGVIHRDLKPANIKVTPDGVVKVLDFGLAKLAESTTPHTDTPQPLSMSPTITSPAMMTGVGVLLGTAAYMSPEQAKGKPADKRSDIWAFGCVLYEMLTAKRAFEGEDVSDTLAAVLRGEPDWTALPADVPMLVSALLKQCVLRDRRQRIGDVAAVLFVLRERSAAVSAPASWSGSVAPSISLWRRATSYVIVAALAGVATSAVWWMFRPSIRHPVLTRSVLTLPDEQVLSPIAAQVIAISRDGTKVAYQTDRGVQVRSMSEPDARLVVPRPGGMNPVFSPDGQWLAFYSSSDRTIRKISVTGGIPVTLCEVTNAPSGISWDAAGIVVGQGSNGIMRVSEEGGKPEVLASVQPGELAAAPHILPDGDSLLFTLARADGGREAWTWDRARIVVQSLASGKRTTLVEGGSDARYVATGHLLYTIGGVLFARPFSLRQLQTTGGPTPVVDGIRRGAGTGQLQNGVLFNAAQFSMSENGTLVYVRGPASLSVRMQPVLVDRDGTATGLKLQPGPYEFPRSSPDGRLVAFGMDDGKEASIWIYDLAGTSSPRRLTFEGHNRFPVWSGDGLWVAFQSDREGDLGIFRQRADGTTGKAERLTRANSGTSHAPESWSPNGESLLFTITKGSDVSLEILSLPDAKATSFPGLRSSVWPNAVFAPDGRRVAYSTRERNQAQNTLYVEPFPPTGEKHQIASGDAHMAVWSRDGRELFFVDPRRLDNGRVGFTRAAIETRENFAVGEPGPVPRPFNITGPGIGRSRTFDILPDGRFIGMMDEAQPGEPVSPRIELVLNWFDELKRLVPTN